MSAEWSVQDSRTVYEGRILNLRLDEVRLPSGRIALREIVEHRPAVAMLPVTGEGTILLVRQYRDAVRQQILEIPAGILNPDESPLEAARRELQEEIGFDAEQLEEWGKFYTSPGFSDEEVTLFFASGLVESRLDPDEDEFIRIVPVRKEEIPTLLDSGRVRDAKTIAALAWYLAKK
ncbi:MAG: NUDIX hydrolase [Synergistaceae bacterium]|jgi:ADP-ribose pyrophosphatase|nr:NUDIX hydrolase [Synergistaceae bacterium]